MTKKRSISSFRLFLICLTLISLSGYTLKPSQKVLPFQGSTSTCILLPSFTADDMLIHHNYYSLSYSEKHKQPKWVAYRLTDEMCQTPAVKRTNRFKSDPLIKPETPVNDYKSSGFDRGHLCPAGDMRWSQIAMEETFYMSNVSPQQPGFNRGIWNRLEQKIRSWAIENHELFITAGSILYDNLPTIGKNKITVPKFFYKAVVTVNSSEPKGIAFVMENKPARQAIYHFAISVDSLERLIGTDLFHALPDSVEYRIESDDSIRKWMK